MMRLTRKLYSEPEEKDDEETWKRNRNIGIVGAGTGGVLALAGHKGLKKKSGAARSLVGSDKGQNFRKLKGGGLALAAASALAAGGSEIKRRKLKKKKDDENKA